MKIIAVFGDSHTWGEGVGAEYAFDPAPCAGDHRMSDFIHPTYVNLLRSALCIETNSKATEYYWEKLARLCDRNEGDFCYISSEVLRIKEDFEFCRVFFKAETQPSNIIIKIDGEVFKEITLKSDNPIPSLRVAPCNLLVPNGGKELEISTSPDQEIGIHRIEFYSGEYAVINCGVGSCPITKYLNEYFDRYIGDISAYGVIFEGCTINDWLTDKTTDNYYNDLISAIDCIKSVTPNIIMHTVFPVAGEQFHGQNTVPYESYVDTMRKAAYDTNIPLADCHKEFTARLSRMSEDKRFRYAYHDVWHPNGTGHYIYAQCIYPFIRKYF